MKVFLTGATGFVISEVASKLRARGDEVVALVRTPAKARQLEAEGCVLVRGDLSDDAAIRAGMKGVDAVIHGAAIYDVGIPRSKRPDMYESNVRGTERVLGAALDLKIPRVVYISTVGAFGNTHGDVVDETFEHKGDYVSYYDETKHLAHVAARKLIAAGLPLVIVQPGGVYGPHDVSPQGKLMSQFLDGKLPAMMFPETGFNFVHRDDLTDGILLALDKGRPGESYVMGGEITTAGALIDTLARVSGRRAPRITLPAVMLKMSIPLGPLLGPALGFGPNLAELVKAADGATYWASDAKARKELGYAPRGLEQGLRDMLEAEGRLPARSG